MIFKTEWLVSQGWLVLWLPLAVLLAATAKPAWDAVGRYRSAAALSTVILAAAWSLMAAPDSGHLAGISYHLLALNLSALMIGAPAALWLGALLLLPYLLLWGGSLHTYPANALSVLLPPLLVNQIARYIVGRMPPNLFIFIFINGFLASAAGVVAVGGVVAALLSATGFFAAEVLWQHAFPVFFLLAWAEAFLSGITTAIFIALRPQWLNTFDDGRYLKSKNQIW